MHNIYDRLSEETVRRIRAIPADVPHTVHQVETKHHLNRLNRVSEFVQQTRMRHIAKQGR